jgi:hypothetical protein
VNNAEEAADSDNLTVDCPITMFCEALDNYFDHENLKQTILDQTEVKNH